MKILVLYYSATGNTRHAAQYIAGRLRATHKDVDLASAEELPPEQVSCDILVFGYPVHAFGIPREAREYIARLPEPDLKGAFVFCTMGMWAGEASRKGLLALKKRGYVPLGGASVAMPIPGRLCTRHSGHREVLAMSANNFDSLPQADEFVENINTVLARVQSGQPVTFSTDSLELDVFSWLASAAGAALLPLSTKLLRGRLKADGRCTGCGYCARICPSGAITVTDKKVTFSEKCTLCLRCLNHCPEQAIDFGPETRGKYRYHGPRQDFRPTERKQ